MPVQAAVPTPRIVGGVEAVPHSLPFVASLRSYSSHICGAGLVSDQWVLTAAHCIAEGASASRYSVGVHRHDIGMAASYDHACSQNIAVAELHVYPLFEKVSLDGDLALLKLASPVRCADSIVTLALDDGSSSAAGTLAITAGWGDANAAMTHAHDQLHWVELPLLSHAQCAGLYYALGHTITSGMLCAGHVPGGEKDSCSGDSGGPLFVQAPPARPVVVGIVSWGVGCAQVNAPGVYTRTSFYKSWIEQVLDCCRRHRPRHPRRRRGCRRPSPRPCRLCRHPRQARRRCRRRRRRRLVHRRCCPSARRVHAMMMASRAVPTWRARSAAATTTGRATRGVTSCSP